jgi:protein-S-isoprenylcysteine O-methyltransferase Ste14
MEKLTQRFGVLAQVAVIVILAVRGELLSDSPFVIGAQVAAVALGIWSRRSFAAGQFRVDATPAEGGIIRTGPYAAIRHPMHAAGLLLVWASILGHWSPASALIGIAFVAVMAIRIPAEERLLAARYPEYAEYRRTTRRLLPFVL